jgi:metal-responsive CopG/Arc/MetJ family transcriptional regulator
VSRRRSKNPTKAISITLPLSMIEKIDDELTRTQSRSLWIANACAASLENKEQEIPLKKLMAMVHARIQAPTLKSLLEEYITSLNLYEVL